MSSLVCLLSTGLFSVFFLVIAPFSVAADSNSNSKVQNDLEVIQVLKRFLAFEEAEQYEKCYGLLSKRYKEELSKEMIIEFGPNGKAKSLPVTTPELYRDLRLKGETHWSNSEITDVEAVKGSSFKITVRSTAMGEGETEVVNKTFLLVKENTIWKIDDIRYTPGRKD